MVLKENCGAVVTLNPKEWVTNGAFVKRLVFQAEKFLLSYGSCQVILVDLTNTVVV